MNGRRGRKRNRPIRRIDQWIVGRKLGGGGNAGVYQATREGTNESVALKVLWTQVGGREPYLRFTREVEFLRDLTIDDGVLPLIDASVPDEPTREHPAWLAMPIAELIRKALSGKPLETVVEAMAKIADTLARLAEQRNIAHRDIKPDNLYCYEGEWLVGDFGLIDIPGMNDLTRQGRPLGPAHYTAYELIADPTISDPRPADVYSLGKTLWVLATEQAYPPEGYQPAGLAGFSIADWRSHPRTAPLDQLIDTMTLLPPGQRPTMAQVATDLRLWLELSGTMPPIDIGDIQSLIRSKLRPELTEQDLQDQRSHQTAVAFDTLRGLFSPINDALRSVNPRAVINGYDSKVRDLLKMPRLTNIARSVMQRFVCTRIESGPDPYPLQLRVGAGVELLEDGTLIVRGLVMCEISGVVPVRSFWLSDPQAAPAGSIETERNIQFIVQQVAENLRPGLEAFLNGLG
ncbi:MAG: serine/threonine protein kinase [Streptosporangiaceae bacterium]